MDTMTEEAGQGHPGGDLVSREWYSVEITQFAGTSVQNVNRAEGGVKAVAAFLRAVANELDPPAAPPAEPGEGTFPAQGLRTDRRGTPDHKDRQGLGNRYFGPVTA